ncbi:MAG: hypothetical protein LM522_02000 [Candidatus Contendobacter sp.]|nr:hypothetical protein [Candidatus Contendobacter sp.]
MPLLLSGLPRYFATHGWLTSLLLVTPLLLGADDNYLREIEDEVKRQATTLTTDLAPSGSSAPTVTAIDATAERLTPGLDLAAFEQALRKSLPGTYTLYQRLNPTGRKQVYEFYRDDSRLVNISGQVTRLLGGKP